MTETTRAFSYTRPAPGASPKQIVRLCATDLLKGDEGILVPRGVHSAADADVNRDGLATMGEAR